MERKRGLRHVGRAVNGDWFSCDCAHPGLDRHDHENFCYETDFCFLQLQKQKQKQKQNRSLMQAGFCLQTQLQGKGYDVVQRNV